MDMVIVLDLSGSNDATFNAILDFTRMLTLGLPVSSEAIRLAVVRYSDTANVSFHLNKYTTNQQVTIETCMALNAACLFHSTSGQSHVVRLSVCMSVCL